MTFMNSLEILVKGKRTGLAEAPRLILEIYIKFQRHFALEN